MSVKALVIIAILSAFLISPAQKSQSRTAAASSAPSIYLVEIANDKGQHYYNVHFETLANKKYTVQASRVMPAASTNWVDVMVAPVFPFASHFIYTEIYTNEVKRYFRLKMQ